MKRVFKVCQEKDCKKEATKKTGPVELCNDHFISLVYDMQPLEIKKARG